MRAFQKPIPNRNSDLIMEELFPELDGCFSSTLTGNRVTKTVELSKYLSLPTCPIDQSVAGSNAICHDRPSNAPIANDPALKSSRKPPLRPVGSVISAR